jgi:selenide,water dikinase
MGGRPLLALNLTAWPANDLPLELLAEVLRGGAEVAARAGCAVVGGHSIDDPEPKYGMAVVGLADPDRLLTLDRARPGDRLLLTRPLGTGVVATAIKRGDPDPAVVAAAVAAMTTLNQDAAEAALAAGVVAATDVTGFGLLGHLHRMLRASGVAGEVDAARVPFLPGAAELAAAGFVSGGTRNNEAFLRDHVDLEPGLPPVVATLLFDAQTSGGLLLAVPPQRLAGLVSDLRGCRVEPALVGRVLQGPAGRIRVRRLPPG